MTKVNTQNILSQDLVHEKLFGYRVVHHENILTSFPARYIDFIKISFENKHFDSCTIMTPRFFVAIPMLKL